jgi:uncharacterized membrane-anchored protein
VRRWLIVLTAAAQVGLLAFMAGQREQVLRTGRTVWLRTAPVDPNDPMRGAYVRLGYEISRVPRALCRDGLAAWMEGRERAADEEWRATRRRLAALRDREVFAVLGTGPHGLAQLEALTDRRPATGLFLRGRVSHGDAREVTVRYGIEALFLQQEKAQELEQEVAARGAKDGVPLDAEIAVGDSGLAVLKGRRWEPLGLTLRTEAAPRDEAATGERRGARPVVAVVATIRNHSALPVAVWLPADGGAFRLDPRPGWGDSQCRWVGAGRARPQPAAADIRILKPGESQVQRIDLTAPEWAVRVRTEDGSPERTLAIPALANEDRHGWSFVLEYAPPSVESLAGLPGAEDFWLPALRSRAFFPGGGAD